MTATSTYVEQVLVELRPRLVDRVQRLGASGLPDPADLADLLRAGLPTPVELDPHYADVGPFYDSAGAMAQLGGITKQALESRRAHRSVLAVRPGDGTWLYPAWQFSGEGGVRDVLVPVLRGLRGFDRWAAGVWLVAEHPDLGGRSPRAALREGADPAEVARLAVRDGAALVA